MCIVSVVYFCKHGTRVYSSTFRGFEGKLILKKKRKEQKKEGYSLSVCRSSLFCGAWSR
jgi:hypothetical protein